MLDVRRQYSDNVIGDRSFSYDPMIVSKIGDFCIDQFTKNNIGTVIKHIPGHGLAKVDSHKKTPIVKEKISKLNKKDFYTFRNKKSFFAMTAHIIYYDIDSHFIFESCTSWWFHAHPKYILKKYTLAKRP